MTVEIGDPHAEGTKGNLSENEHTVEPVEGSAEARCYFVRGRNALAVRIPFESIYVDHYLHLMQHGITLDPEHDQMLKDALAALALHLASRPWNEVTALTIHFQDPLLNLFVTGDSRIGNIVGRAFTEDVKDSGTNLLLAQINDHSKPPRRSIVEFEGTDLFRAVEQFYEQSEQRPARYFDHSEEDYVMVTAQPQCDMPWFESLDDDAIRALDQTEELSLLERRHYRYDCGCTIDRVLPALSPLGPQDLDELFLDDSHLKVTCPRCAAKFLVTRTEIERFRAR